MKSIDDKKQNTHLNRFWWTFLAIAILFIMEIGFISALNFDNSKSYNLKTKTITITNAFGLGSKIAEIKLNTPLVYYVIRGEDRLVAEFEINNFNKYNNAFNKLEFYDKKKNDNKIQREFIYKYKSNGEWIVFNSESELPKGKIIIGIFTDVYPGDRIEWIPTLFGSKISEWAVWTESLTVDLMHYFPFNETTGTVIENVVNGTANMSGTSGQQVVAGIIGYGYNATSGDQEDMNINLSGYSNISMNFWINETGDIPETAIFASPTQETGTIRAWYSGNSFSIRVQGVADNLQTTNRALENNKFQMITIVINDTFGAVYQNGTLWWNESTDWIPFTDFFRMFGQPDGAGVDLSNVTLDEFGIWNRTLSTNEITQLYNNGIGITLEETTINIKRNNPADKLSSINRTVAFNCSGEVTGGTIANISLWFDGVLNFTKTGTTDKEELYTSVNFTERKLNWTCKLEDNIKRIFQTSNRSINITNFIDTSQSFSLDILEGSNDLFTLNISILDTLQPAIAQLIYNNTAYTTKITSLSGGNYTISKNLSVDFVTADINQTFWWNISLSNGNVYNTTKTNQTVRNMNIDDCTSYTILLLNLSLKDEGNQSVLNGARENSSIEIDLDISSLAGKSIVNFSQNYSEDTNPQVCLENDLNISTFRLDAQIQYGGDLYEPEFYHIQNFILSNSSLPQNINLFDLLSDDSQQFLITFKDANFIATPNALINIQRKYVSEGTFKTVEIPKTDNDGQTTGHFDLDNVIYTIIVSKEGVVLATFNNIAVVCQDLIISDCRLNLNAILIGNEFPDWDEVGGITHTISFDKSTRTVTATFTTADGSSRTILLNTTKYDMFGNETICIDTLTSSSGTLTCLIPDSYGNVTVISRLFSGGELITTKTFRIIEDIADRFGTNGIIMTLILVITIPLMLVSSPIGIIIGVMVGLAMASMLMLYEGGGISMGSVLIWIMVAGGILIWRIAKNS